MNEQTTSPEILDTLEVPAQPVAAAELVSEPATLEAQPEPVMLEAAPAPVMLDAPPQQTMLEAPAEQTMLDAAPAQPVAPVKAPKPPPDPATLQRQQEARARAQAAWQALVDAKESAVTVHGTVKSAVKGGLLVDVTGFRGFLPASQVGVPKGTPIETLVGQQAPFKVLDVDEARKRVVVSHRRATQEERRNARNELLRSLKVGEDRPATVVRLTDFGAFVDLGSGIDALIPLRELALEHIEKAADVVTPGEQLNVRIIRIDDKGKKIAASRRALLPDPWREHAQVLSQGNVVTGTVVAKEPRLQVEVAPGVIGSISDREADPAEYEIGESVEVTIRGVDMRNRRLRLSTMAAAAAITSSSSGFAPLGIELGSR
jgi:ribosomal protein S1